MQFLVSEIWSILYSKFIVNWDFDDCVFNFFRTWFRNANQWYPITSWLGGFNPKASGAWGRGPQKKQGLGKQSPNMNKFLHSFFLNNFDKRTKNDSFWAEVGGRGHLHIVHVEITQFVIKFDQTMQTKNVGFFCRA